MTFIVAALLFALAIQAAVIASLLLQRRVLRQSEAFFRRVADGAPIIMWTNGPDATLTYLNNFCMEFTGLPLQELLGDGWLKVVHPDDIDHCLGIYVPAIEARQPFLMEYRIRRDDGIYRWIMDSAIPCYEPDGSYTGHIGCSVDITERKQAEEALLVSHREIQHLAGRLIEAQEFERARIARDLHDDVSQQLAGISIAFSGLKRRLAGYHVSADLQQELVELQQQTLILARNVRHLSHDLHPTVLQHLGLVKGLRSYCGELARGHGLAIQCTTEGDFASMTPDAALCVYRIAQEALRNVIAHAGATGADVRLLRSGDQAEITITDDGKGFNAATRLEMNKGLGLVSISERARIAGGAVSIVSRLNQGTCVQAAIPINARVKTNVDSGMAGQVA